MRSSRPKPPKSLANHGRPCQHVLRSRPPGRSGLARVLRRCGSAPTTSARSTPTRSAPPPALPPSTLKSTVSPTLPACRILRSLARRPLPRHGTGTSPPPCSISRRTSSRPASTPALPAFAKGLASSAGSGVLIVSELCRNKQYPSKTGRYSGRRGGEGQSCQPYKKRHIGEGFQI